MTDAPRVDVDPTMTKKWLKLTNSNTASLAELAILNNLEIVAHQNRHIMGTQEKIMAAITSIQCSISGAPSEFCILTPPEPVVAQAALAMLAAKVASSAALELSANKEKQEQGQLKLKSL